MTAEGRFKVTHFFKLFLWEACGKQNVSSDLPSGEKKRKKSTVTVRFMAQPSVFLFVSSSSANGLTSGGPSILAPRLPSVSQMMFSGLFWLLTCFMQPLPSWWPCGFTATPIFSSRSPPFLGRQVCPTASRRTPSTKINSLLMLSDLLS